MHFHMHFLEGNRVSLSVSKRMAAIKPSPTGAVLALPAELARPGGILSAWVPANRISTRRNTSRMPLAAIQGWRDQVHASRRHCRAESGYSAEVRRENQLDYETSQISFQWRQAVPCSILCMALLGPGDEAIIPAPYWVSYPDMVRLAGAEPIIVDAGIDQDFKITAQQLDAQSRTSTRLLILNSPSNPTGASYSKPNCRPRARCSQRIRTS